jgi:Glycosyl hydrolases family 2, TIM barrel domain/Ricin-type beta-trefoil lectin domain-like/Glycosyl hydrolases family 2
MPIRSLSNAATKLLKPVMAMLLLLLLLGATGAKAETTQDLSSAAGISWSIRPEGDNGWHPIQVPAGGWRTQGHTCDAADYRATVRIPAAVRDQFVQLHFEAVNFGCEVYAGEPGSTLRLAGEHVNGWMPFDVSLTGIANPGSMVAVEVRVRGRRKFMHDGKYTVPEGATWDDKLEEGILRGVSLRIRPKLHLETAYIQTVPAASVNAKSAYDTVRAVITLVNAGASPRHVTVVAGYKAWGNRAKFAYPGEAHFQVSIAPGETRIVDTGAVRWPGGASSYWWPNVPYRAVYTAKLHELHVRVIEGTTVVDTLKQRFGFRDFAISKRVKHPELLTGPEAVLNGAHYELNGVRCNLRGDNQQEANFGTDAYGIKPGFGRPTPANPGWPAAVDNLLRLNFNVMRIHQIPATPYMLDVCDEKGLMIVDESPLRGSEGGEDFEAGKEYMIAMDRELVQRDRCHPSVVIWSAANEWTTPIPFVVPVIIASDSTRPIIADGVGDFDPRFVNMEHYVNGIAGLPTRGATHRTDRPYGETEAIWSADNTRQGFAWMATSVRLRRVLGNSDLRNYVLNNAWSSYVPGESAETEILEKAVKQMDGDKKILPAIKDPWNNPLIRLMQQNYAPVVLCDTGFDKQNARSNANGDWPTMVPTLIAGSEVHRQIAMFNDTFSDAKLTLEYELSTGQGPKAKLISGKVEKLTDAGYFTVADVTFTAPAAPCEISAHFTLKYNGVEAFHEDAIKYRVVPEGTITVPDGDYLLVNANSGLPASVRADGTLTQAEQGAGAVWHIKHLGGDGVTLTNVATGEVLAVQHNGVQNGAPAIDAKWNGLTNQVWRLLQTEDGNAYTITSKSSGRSLDVYGRSMIPGGAIVVWEANGGENQKWRLVPSTHK